jgi:hypothetical protein
MFFNFIPKLSLALISLLIMPAILYAKELPRVFLLDAESLVAAHAQLDDGEPSLQRAREQLIGQAEEAMSVEPLSVVDDSIVPSSGDKHDYMSVGPYWWPDPNKSDGLPYIRRDGEVNPEYNDYDGPKIRKLTDAVRTLSLAYFFTGRESYAEHAALLLRVWFLDEATRMNPHLEYGQAIPGRCTGRGIGIIETRRMAELVDSVGLLASSLAWSDEDQEGFKDWIDDYLIWILTSKYGVDESKTRNNHATWYDVQAVAMAAFVGRDDVARRILDEAGSRRMATQIEPDGRQPHETARTKGFSYSVMNLSGFFDLATLSVHSDLDLWRFETEAGEGDVRTALDYLLPYALGEKVWPYQQISGVHGESLIPLLRRASIVYGEPEYIDAAKQLEEESDAPDFIMDLLYLKAK